MRGFCFVWKEERNFRIQLYLAGVAVVFLFLLDFTPLESAVIVLCMAVILAAEMFNTFVEDLLDALHPQRDPNVGKVKDIMAGIVLLMCTVAVAVGAITVAQHSW
jgi:diacylglycerol kinase (ATP)